MHVDYETYASMSPLRKNHVLSQLTAENKAELVRAHIGRFLSGNRARLNAEQVRALEDVLARYPDVREYTEERMRELFPLELLLQFHMEVFNNSGEIRNPIALSLVRERPKTEDVETLRAALYDMATLGPDELRSRRPDLPSLLKRHYKNMPDDFWPFVADEDVPLAASRAYAITGPRRQAGAPPPPAPPC